MNDLLNDTENICAECVHCDVNDDEWWYTLFGEDVTNQIACDDFEKE